MRKLFWTLLIVFFTVGILVNDADARRFGGGRSFGMQRSASSFTSARAAQPSQMPRQGSTASKWLGPIAGLAAGGLLASLFMGHGMGSGIMSWLMIAGIGFLAWNLLRRRFQPATSPSPQQFNQYRDNVGQNANSQFSPSAAAYSPVNNAPLYPAGFEPVAFLRDAKVQFIRLQAAYDSKNLNDIREFTSPEVFAEIQLQLQERGNEVNVTEVVSLDAELLDAASEYQSLVATVRFTGMIRENVGEAAMPLNETWHFRKDHNQFAWTVSGVQQLVH